MCGAQEEKLAGATLLIFANKQASGPPPPLAPTLAPFRLHRPSRPLTRPFLLVCLLACFLLSHQDIPGALPAAEVERLLGLEAMLGSRHWRIVSCSAVSGRCSRSRPRLVPPTFPRFDSAVPFVIAAALGPDFDRSRSFPSRGVRVAAPPAACWKGSTGSWPTLARASSCSTKSHQREDADCGCCSCMRLKSLC